MSKFVQLGEQIINLDQVVRVERGGQVTDAQPTVIVYFLGGDDERVQSYFTGPQAEAVWNHFAGIAERWDLPKQEQPPGAAVARPRSQP